MPGSLVDRKLLGQLLGKSRRTQQVHMFVHSCTRAGARLHPPALSELQGCTPQPCLSCKVAPV